MINKNTLIFNFFAAFIGFCPQFSFADKFTSADVLAWERTEQDTMFQTSVGMATIVANQTGTHTAFVECIEGWYWQDGEARRVANDEIRAALRRFPEYHPQIMIFAALEKACGDF